ncbi:MAG: class II fumarate hydratase [Bacteroidales bacterium]|jgi:fumarate hydratase class II|nr:class II fumarate hydratase [Bacteroidales bacterium]MCK9498088.1 class II fumarate hydratase [Bacteroidales bacterium]MDY0313578.1 class II fumarate hydratase [Bacteroidales bacterium]NLB86960.1 class II fumarate hydratase [Bacteroidales bacterium]NLB87027.1 class II fumarate hydratase [Bacteroidales bacterium]
MTKFRQEKDSMGFVEVPADKYWGAQTQRSLQNFKIGGKMPIEVIYAMAILKKSCAKANQIKGVLSEEKAKLIAMVCDEICQAKHDEQFPLVVFQTGSGTQTNMNLNEVIANRAHVINGGKLSDSKKILHPNDDVNKSQSSNDTFPSAMNIAAKTLIVNKTLPSLRRLYEEFVKLSKKFSDKIKTGRTHMMDATPISFGQEFSGYAAQIEYGIKTLEKSLDHLSELAIGGTAVGTGLNAPKGYDKEVCKYVSEYSKIEFKTANNKFEALAAQDSILETHSALKQIATAIYKIANDFRLMASGPRCGLNEIFIPENEPGSSIMPGKVNPTQIEAITMVCAQIIGNDLSITTSAMNGHFELNVFRPVMIKNFLESANILAEACDSFLDNCLAGVEINDKQVQEYLNKSLMTVTALNTAIGYDKAAEIAKNAHNKGISLKKSAMQIGIISEKDFDNIVDPRKMI